MLLSKEHNNILSESAAWIIRRIDTQIYYIKYKFLASNEYLLLVTDLCLVWFEHGDHVRMKQDAKQELGMEFKDRAASLLIYNKIKTNLGESINECDIKKEENSLKLFLPLEKGDIAALSWVFNCALLQQVNQDHDYLSGPQVIHDYFILPSQSIVNYFTENILGKLFYHYTASLSCINNFCVS